MLRHLLTRVQTRVPLASGRRLFSTGGITEVKLSDEEMASFTQLQRKRKVPVLELLGILAIVSGSGLYMLYIKDEREKLMTAIDQGTYDPKVPRPQFLDWLQAKAKSLTSADCESASPSHDALMQLSRLPPQALTDQFLLWQRLNGFPPSPADTEPSTKVKFPTVCTLPVPAETKTNGYVLPSSLALVGLGVRAMLNWYWLGAARVYSYGVYMSTLDYSRHFYDLQEAKSDATKDAQAQSKPFAGDFAHAPAKAVVLQFTQSGAGSHIAHGFERTFGNRIEDGRAKRNMLGQRVDLAGDGQLDLSIDAQGDIVDARASAVEEPPKEKENFMSFLKNVFDSKPQVDIQQRTPDTYGVGGVLALEALRCTADSVPEFQVDDQLVFSWGRENDALMVTMAGKQQLDVDKLCGSSLGTANTLSLIQLRVKEQYAAAHAGAIPPLQVMKGVEAAVASLPSCWQVRGDGVHVFDSQRVLPLVNDVIARASRGEVVSAADVSIPSSQTAWVTANLNEKDKARFSQATGIPSAPTTTPENSKNKVLVPNARIVIRDPALSLAVMKTYVGSSAINTYASGQMDDHWAMKP